MEPQNYRRSYDLVPRTSDRGVKGGGPTKGQAIETSPVLGRWSRLMLSALRKMHAEAVLLGDSKLMERIEIAYWYLYSRTRKNRRAK